MMTTAPLSPEERGRFPILTRFLSGTGLAYRYTRKMMAAGILLRGEEFLVLVLVTTVGAAGVLTVIVKQWWGLVLGGLLGFLIPNGFLNWRINQRRSQLENQLADALTIIANALSIGYGFLQGAKIAADQLPPPIAEELDRVVRLSSMGMPLEQALRLMGERVQSYDYDLAISAILVQLRRGGNLSRMLHIIADTIRQRQELRGEITAATAQARFSGWILMALPLFTALIIMAINPRWMQLLIGTETGHKLIWLGVFLQTMGMVTIRRILRVEL